MRRLDREAQLNDLGDVALPPAAGRGAGEPAQGRRLGEARTPRSTDERIEAPVVVIGMFRAGTTLPQPPARPGPAQPRAARAGSRRTRVPPPTPGDARTGPRVDAAQGGVDMLELLNPAISAIHHEARRRPDRVHRGDGAGLQEPLAGRRSPTCRRTAPGGAPATTAPAYEYHRLVLQVLQSGGVRGRWTLKSPHHALALDALVDIYPDARLVLLHRDPVVLTASVCSLISTSCRARSPTPTTAPTSPSTGATTLEESVRRIDDFRARRPEHPILDVHTPTWPGPGRHRAGALRRPRPRARRRGVRRDQTGTSPEHPRGVRRHRYDVGEFGLTEAGVRARFRGYTASERRAERRSSEDPRALRAT